MSTVLLRTALDQQEATLRLAAAGFLLLRNDLSGMESVEGALTRSEGLSGYVVHNLDYAIAEGIKDKGAIPSLSRLARAGNLETRRAAASGLRHTNAAPALKPLADLLDDSDLQVRHEGVMGLAEISKEPDWGPNMDVFQSEEQKYIKYWRDWAAPNGLLK